MKTMKTRTAKSQQGFSLLELMVAAVIGIIVLVSMLSLFRTGMNTTFSVTQKAEVQENLRSGVELITKDLGLAGAGLPTGGLQLPTSGGSAKVACNQSGTCYVTGDVYPSGNYMYGILPGYANGVQSGTPITAAPGAINDSITSIYCDYNFPLSNFTFSFPSTTQATVGVISAPAAGVPTNILAPGGLNVGDLIFFQVTSPGNGTGNQGTSASQTAAVVGEITGLPSNTQINFASGDALNFNQTGANSLANTISSLGSNLGATGTTTGNQVTACRLQAVTYFIQVPATGGTVQTPRLMRQVNGLTAVPVADNIINLQFTYDVINSVNSTISANQANPIAAGLSPALIQKVNLWMLGQGLLPASGKAQSAYLATSVSARNMSFCNSYSSSSTVCQ
jgi:type II secretory pathway pseudopilin PulG